MARYYQCVFCKQTIKPEEDAHRLDPFALDLISNFDLDPLDRKSQTFFCHIACFRRVAQTDDVLYIMDRGTLTPREMQAEEEIREASLFAILRWLERYGAEYAVWERLVVEETGSWLKLADLVRAEALDTLRLRLEEEMGHPVLITYVADYHVGQRPLRDSILVLLAADSYYEYLGSLLISRP